MAKLIRSNFLCALAEGQPVFSAGTGRFTFWTPFRTDVRVSGSPLAKYTTRFTWPVESQTVLNVSGHARTIDAMLPRVSGTCSPATAVKAPLFQT